MECRRRPLRYVIVAPRRSLPALVIALSAACSPESRPAQDATPAPVLALGNAPAAAVLPPTFRRDDFVLVLVTGEPLQSTLAGYSGKGSLYVANGTTTGNRLTFGGVSGAQGVNLERRSGTDVTNRGNYGTSAYIPPGVYFLHYHRLDPTHGGRPRLGLSDARCGEVIGRRAGGAPVDRLNLQFHIAYNDLAEFEPNVSEGCVTLRRAEFGQLFPASFFGADSPLPGCTSHTTPAAFAGAGRILVFVTDASDAAVHQRQLALFQKIVRGEAGSGLVAAHFNSGSAELGAFRARWNTGF
jgi:hypothetical protein